MFKRNKKNNTVLEGEIIVSTSKREENFERINGKQETPIKDFEVISNIEKESTEYTEGKFKYFDKDPQNECSVDDSIEEVVEAKDRKVKKKDLSSFFEKSKRENNLILEKKTKVKRKSRKQREKEEEELSRSERVEVYTFRNVKYTKVEDFIKYLELHSLDLEEISKEALADELFYAWLSKRSDVFEDSVKQFKEIKERIEKK